MKQGHVIVVGNEKGGSGKSTVAMHVAIGLLRLGYRVATVDLDSHQATLTSYMKNRWKYVEAAGENIPSPTHIHIDAARTDHVLKNREEERWRVETAVAEAKAAHDFVVIDTPGSDRFISIVGHACADTLLTPVNDSFVDLDLLAKIDPNTKTITAPSVYTQMVWDLRRKLKTSEGRVMQWFVMRNRLGTMSNQNMQDVDAV